ncbi:S8 family serine peptidase [Pedobacter ureilyticus]|uniref:S8 family serine peptidase n=1 Tax=Pedobacter ureilyticus TaxID=1393051 RepID=A0ABW9J4G7_9SPHI|nr:S8 family serine peptidase [Pedobacter helvus]
MRSLKLPYLLLTILVISCLINIDKLYAQANKQNQTNTVFLKQNAIELNTMQINKRSRAFTLAAEKGWETFGITREGKVFSLYGVDDFGLPLYKITENNAISAATINTNKLYAGGSLGLNLSGSTIPNDKIAIWDGGAVLTTHIEFQNNRVEVKDGATSSSSHATHVAGTIMAEGKNPNAKGMAYGLPKLLSFDFNNDNSEMSNYAASLLISNHSYGTSAGWYENTTANRWEFLGRPGENEDYKFGYYDTDAQEWDKICYNAPYYLPVKSGGNYRNSNGPAVGTNYFRYNTNKILVDAGPRPAGISSNDGYDILGTYAVAKNIMTVAAVNPLTYGTVTPSDITISSFSAWGPTDDGRIKPDIAADGVNVTSTTNTTGNQSYTTLSGTSMAAPSVSGSLVLLQELYHQKNNSFMRAATLKALTLGTASEAGPNPGPDYIFGWGLMNTESAAKAILTNGTKSSITEKVLSQGATENFNVIASGDGPIIATIAWTDPEATVIPEQNALNNPTLRLVNDLDMRASDGITTFSPWILNPANPSSAATKGDNFRDNVEQIFIADAVPGKTYTFTISHKGTLKSGSQAYSIVVTGIGGNPYCASAPLSPNDSKITGFSLANINYTAAAGCTSYNDFTNQTIELEKARTYPLTLSLGTCGANFNKVAKVFMDWNGDGDFNDSNELVATSAVINGTGLLTANLSVPTTVGINSFSLLRLVLAETNDANVVQACGNYTKGETQDYRVKFVGTSTDVGIAAIKDRTSNCSNPQQTVTVVIRNFGTQSISNITVNATITEANNTIATLSGTYTGEIKPSQEQEFTLPGTYAANAGKTYQINAKTLLSTDLVSSNDAMIKTEQVSLAPALANTTAFYCDNTKQYQLSANGDGITYWYENNTSTVPIAYGNNISTTITSANNTYYAALNDYTSTLGPKNKYEARLGSGTYLQTTSKVNVRVSAPTILESARLYIGYPGTIKIYVENETGVEVSSTTLRVNATRNVPMAGTAPDDLTDQGEVYFLNLTFPTAGNYSIRTVYEDGATIFRNNGVSSSIYPLSSALEIFNITGNNATQPASFYYYFYDVKVKALGCMGAARVEVPVPKFLIARNGDELVTNLVGNTSWYVNGAQIENATGQTYKPLKAGKYQAWTTIGNNCIVISNEITFLNTNSGENEIKLQIFPVPTARELTVAFEITNQQAVTLSLTNILGQQVYQQSKQMSGTVIENLNVSKFAKGTYVLTIKTAEKIYSKKIVII